MKKIIQDTISGNRRRWDVGISFRRNKRTGHADNGGKYSAKEDNPAYNAGGMDGEKKYALIEIARTRHLLCGTSQSTGPKGAPGSSQKKRADITR